VEEDPETEHWRAGDGGDDVAYDAGDVACDAVVVVVGDLVLADPSGWRIATTCVAVAVADSDSDFASDADVDVDAGSNAADARVDSAPSEAC
jgi:hypothetical protein